MAYDKLVIDDLTGGMTDHVKLGNVNTGEMLKNVLVTHEGGVRTRPGTDFLIGAVHNLPNVESPNLFVDFKDNLFVNSGKEIYRCDTTSINRLIGSPSLHTPFNLGSSTINFSSCTEWQNQLYWVNDAYAKPIRVFKDGSNVWQVQTAGLPKLTTAEVTVLTFSKGGGAGHTYLYAFVRKYTYTVGTVTYIIESAVSDYKTCVTTNAIAGAGDANVITVIPILSNGTDYNYDTTSVKVDVYRTIDLGHTFYYVGEITNGTTTITDSTTDANLILKAYLYITPDPDTGLGPLDNDEPPLSKYIMTVEGVTYYANVQENGENKEVRLRQSKLNNPDHCPGAMYKDFLKNITGLSYIRNIPIVFAYNMMWRLTGTFADDGSGGIEAILISSTFGTVSNNSIIQFNDKLLFASNKGFAITDGYNVQLISDHMRDMYEPLISTVTRGKQIYGCYDKFRDLAYWACQVDDRNTQNDSIYVFHAYHGVKAESCFTLWDNPDNSYPHCIMVYDGYLTRGEKQGFLLKHNDLYRNDVKIDFSANRTHIPYDIISTELFTNSKEVEKYGAKIMVRAKNVSNLSLQIWSSNNGYKNWKALEEIRTRDHLPWYKRYVSWETDPVNYSWEMSEDIIQARYLPAKGSIRYYTKQIRFTPSLTVIEKSDVIGTATATVTALPYILTLDDAFIWPDNCDGHYIKFEDDNYEKKYYISNRLSDTVIEIIDVDLTLTAGSRKWIMVGYPKDEIFELISYTLSFTSSGDGVRGFKTADTGKNA